MHTARARACLPVLSKMMDCETLKKSDFLSRNAFFLKSEKKKKIKEETQKRAEQRKKKKKRTF